MNFSIFKLVRMSWLVLCGVWSLSVLADSTIKVSTIKLSPLGFTQNGQDQGIFYDIANQIVLNAGYTPENKILPYPRVIQTLMTGSKDISILFTNEAVAKSSDQLMPILEFENIIVGLRGSTYERLSDLHGQTIANVRQAVYDEALNEDKLIKKHPTTGYEQSIKMLLGGRVDAIVGAGITIYYTLEKLGYTAAILGKPFVLNSKDAYLHFSRQSQHQDAKDKITKAAKNLKEQGVIDKIIEGYRGKR